MLWKDWAVVRETKGRGSLIFDDARIRRRQLAQIEEAIMMVRQHNDRVVCVDSSTLSVDSVQSCRINKLLRLSWLGSGRFSDLSRSQRSLKGGEAKKCQFKA